jgi:hypothetical protein
MQDKLLILLSYALIGIALGIWPMCTRPKFSWPNLSFVLESKLSPNLMVLRWISILLLLFISIWMLGNRDMMGWYFNFFLVSAVISYKNKRVDFSVLLVAFLALIISTTIPWWSNTEGVIKASWPAKITFDFIVLTLYFLLHAGRKDADKKNTTFWIIAFVFPSIVLSFSTGILAVDAPWVTEWHHWGAYIGPAESLLAGAVVFHDFPVQYGVGPTLLIAAFCKYDCWRGMYFIVGFATLIYSSLIALLCITVSHGKWSTRIAVLLLVLITCFFWTAYPPDVSLPSITPSVGGLRFLPALILITYLFFLEKIENSRLKLAGAHLIWAVGVFWSPESCFYVTFIWWPYYLFLNRSKNETSIRLLIINLTRLIGTAAGFMILFISIFFLIYRQLPSTYGIFAYVINPPGPMPINIYGAVWFFIFSLCLGLGCLVKKWQSSGDSISFRRGYLSLLLCYAVFSYFLGRSHDNNLLNITPFVLLMLLNVVASFNETIFSKVSTIIIATFAGWLILFGWNSLQTSFNQEGFLKFQSDFMKNSSTLRNPQTVSRLTERIFKNNLPFGAPQDVARAINEIHGKYREPYTVLDSSMLLEHSSPPKVWSAIQNPANFTFVPSARRRQFLLFSAHSLGTPGWLIVDKKYPAGEWLSDFDFAYNRDAILDFDSYYAIRFIPKKSF